ncbi:MULTISPECIES: NAD(P)/FAD-dependent oxidoreductase [Rhodococcus]|uniref:NAD(P)/FAD-dependent oxidoreductase n=1 Tax=Rhodococcus TaxID=1827 RepID=UPI00071D0E99|nr:MULTISPECIES: FAD-dependent oxidoreductase [Rhodococcus]ANQ75629.1 hypothetical protein AOT96_31925 [Rhodococcus sp. 008]KSU70616.1 hypothetical protein AS032_27115 [Rhodococcus qingshengii]SCC64230.1 NADPH-dependent 2,4-dienoyl-CoA reductase, sulfur reductase [Rhodococcus qingshengii]
MSGEHDVVIVGGGIAAVRCAQGLRENGHAGRITLLTEESHYPYDRPPLSKDMLRPQNPSEPTWLLDPEEAVALDVDVRTRQEVVSVDVHGRTVSTAGGSEPIGYDSLVVATGTRARRLPVLAGVEGVHYLRTADDAQSIRDALRPGSSVTIVGGGFIGLEIAAMARARGCEVTIVEAAEHPLALALGAELAAWLQQWHTGHGVRFRCGVGVKRASRWAGQVIVTLDDGSDVLSDSVVVGVGVHRDLDWLSASGIRTHVGLVCDVDGRTDVEGVFGAGDVVCTHVDETCAPVQHWTAAGESGQRVARTILGQGPEEWVDEHYFWSNQGALRLMSVGGRTPEAELEIVAGDLESGKFVAHWTENGRVVGVLGANSARGFLQGRAAFVAGLDRAGPRR